MIKLVALKKLRYPRGPDGKEYNRGDQFEVLSERDAKALTLYRAAQAAPITPLRVAEPMPPKSRVQTRDLLAEEPQRPAPELPAQKAGVDEQDRPKRGRGRYLRTDLTAED